MKKERLIITEYAGTVWEKSYTTYGFYDDETRVWYTDVGICSPRCVRRAKRSSD